MTQARGKVLPGAGPTPSRPIPRMVVPDTLIPNCCQRRRSRRALRSARPSRTPARSARSRLGVAGSGTTLSTSPAPARWATPSPWGSSLAEALLQSGRDAPCAPRTGPTCRRSSATPTMTWTPSRIASAPTTASRSSASPTTPPCVGRLRRWRSKWPVAMPFTSAAFAHPRSATATRCETLSSRGRGSCAWSRLLADRRHPARFADSLPR